MEMDPFRLDAENTSEWKHLIFLRGRVSQDILLNKKILATVYFCGLALSVHEIESRYFIFITLSRCR